MVQRQNVDSGHSSFQLDDRSGRRRHSVADLSKFKLSVAPTIGPIPACETIRNDLAKRATDAANSGDQAAQDKANALSTQSDADFSSCFAEKAPQQAGFAAAVTAAQSLIGRLPSH